MRIRPIYASTLFLILLTRLHPASAQSSDSPPPSGEQTETLHMSSRIVLTDVTVTDSKGNPIHGLTQSDFHIYDDKQPQTLSSFEEHTQTTGPASISLPSDPNIGSNAFLLHPPSPVNVILIDSTTTGLIDQMYLYEELNRFVRALPPGEPVAIYYRFGPTTILLQNFTSDHILLMAAIRRAKPGLRPFGGWYSSSDEDTLLQMAIDLHQISGRKNLIWFTTGPNLLLQYTSPSYQVFGGGRQFSHYYQFQPRRDLYDLLESERIALYPVDPRGLTVDIRAGMAAQQMQMAEDAEATGGKAVYNNNFLSDVVENIISTDGSYYTLTYAPHGLQQNNKWHRVEVTLADPRYRLSYRRGYYDDNGRSDLASLRQSRTLLGATGQSAHTPVYQGDPIIFQARALSLASLPQSVSTKPSAASVPLKKNETPYFVHYLIPAKDLQPSTIQNSIGTDNLRSAIFAFDGTGNSIARGLVGVVFNVDQNKLHAQPDGLVDFDQQINLPPGQDTLYLVIEDTTTNRYGTVSLSVDVKKPSKSKP